MRNELLSAVDKIISNGGHISDETKEKLVKVCHLAELWAEDFMADETTFYIDPKTNSANFVIESFDMVLKKDVLKRSADVRYADSVKLSNGDENESIIITLRVDNIVSEVKNQ